MGSHNGNKKSIPNDGSAEFKEKDIDGMDIVKTIAVAAGVALAAWGISKLIGTGCSGTSDNRRMMKAPGRDFRIYREDFELDPASYFRDLRK